MQFHTRVAVLFFSLSALFAVSACERPRLEETKEAKPSPQVAVITIQPSPRPVIRELPGRIASVRIAEIRARVAGIVMERLFQQGADVKAGDILYRIDPAPFEVELDAAKAALAKAKAVLQLAERHAQRTEKLRQTLVVSEAHYDKAMASLREAKADVAARQAAVARAELDLGYTTVRAPISGRIDAALVTEGALVSKGETHLATVQQLDPIYADFIQSAGELRQLRRDFESGELKQISPESMKVRLELDDGTLYPYPGRLLFSGATVDRTTGQVTLRGEFPNPKHELLPGMYVRIRIEQGIDADALAVPQQAVRRSDAGDSEVYVVRADNRAVLQPVRLGQLVDEHWLVLEGLKPGDRVIVEGFQKFAAGEVVDPVPWSQAVSASAAKEPTSPKTD